MRLALQVDVLEEAPAAGLELGGLEGRAFGRREHQPDDVLRHVRRDLARLVADHDASLIRGLQIDHVRADGACGDEPQVGQLLQRLPVPLHRAPRVHDHPGTLDPGKLLVEARGPVGVHGHVAVRLQPVQVRRPLNLGRVVARRYDLETLVDHSILLAARMSYWCRPSARSHPGRSSIFLIPSGLLVNL